MQKQIQVITIRKNQSALTRELLQAGFYVTVLEATGGFSQERFSLIMLAVAPEKENQVLEITRRICAAQTILTTNGVPLPVFGPEDLVQSQSGQRTKIKVGGATVFISALERVEKL